jgi:hypothetical protein
MSLLIVRSHALSLNLFTPFVLISILLALLLAGCDKQVYPAGSGSMKHGILIGTVTFVGVPCPPDRRKVPPCDGPYPDYEVVIFNRDGRTAVARTITDKDGRFRVELPEGNYVIYSKGYERRTLQIPHHIEIKAGKTAQLDITIDTGIR